MVIHTVDEVGVDELGINQIKHFFFLCLNILNLYFLHYLVLMRMEHTTEHIRVNSIDNVRRVFDDKGRGSIIIPHANCVCGWVYCFHVVRPSIRPSVRPSVHSSVTFCFLNIFKSH